MRLTKIQKALKNLGIEYRYYEDTEGICGGVCFDFKNHYYSFAEVKGKRSKTPIGIWSNIEILNFTNQNYIVGFLLKLKAG